VILVLPTRLDYGNLESLCRDIKAHSNNTLMIDASEVSFLGVLALQILASAKIEWETAGYGFSIHDPSVAFLQSVTLLGAHTLLGTGSIE
jgi:chemotaxis protein CheX